MSTNLENRAERQGKRESRRQASEAQGKTKDIFFLLKEQHENFVAAVTK